MPGRRLTQLPVLAALSTDDIFYVVDDPAGAANSRQVAASVFDARYLQTANNLSDLTNVVVARASLGLGTLATVNDAPADGTIYGRQNNAWAAATGILPVIDTTAIVKGSVTATKQLRFEVDGFTAATTRVITPPDADIILAGQNYANVFTASNVFSAGLQSYKNGLTGNVIIGLNAGNATMTGTSNFLLGSSVGLLLTLGYSNTAIGFSALRTATTGFENVAIGSYALEYVDTWYRNVAIGYQAGNAITGQQNVIIGWKAGLATTGSSNVFLGASAGGAELGSSRLYIANSNTAAPLIYGEFDNAILKFHSTINSDAVVNTLSLVRRRATGTPGAGLGTALRFALHSSTTESQEAARLAALWQTATHASRVADLVAYASYSGGEVEIWRGRAGAAPLFGVLGATPIARPASYTLASTAGRVMPTPEAAFTGQDNAQVGAVYAKSADLITLQTRLNAVEGVLRQVIIDLASTSGFGFLAAA